MYLENDSLIVINKIKDNIFSFFLITFVIVFTLILFFNTGSYALVDNNIVIATLILVINVPFHELGHIVFLKIFYKEAKIKMGFKFIFIFPAFFVNTSYSYLLPKFKRISVYLAGSFINCLFVLIIYFFFPQYLQYCYVLITNILINFIPVIKTDGYYAFVTLLNKYNFSKNKTIDFIENFIRGFIMFLIISLLYYLF